MTKHIDTSAAVPTLEEIYPLFSHEQIKETEELLRQYLDLALQVYERVCNDQQVYARFRALTESVRQSKIDSDGSSCSQPS